MPEESISYGPSDWSEDLAPMRVYLIEAMMSATVGDLFPTKPADFDIPTVMVKNADGDESVELDVDNLPDWFVRDSIFLALRKAYKSYEIARDAAFDNLSKADQDRIAKALGKTSETAGRFRKRQDRTVKASPKEMSDADKIKLTFG